MTSASICEVPSFHYISSIIGLTRPSTSDTPSTVKKVRIQFHRSLWLKTSNSDQYYSTATTTVFFYDFLLTLPDEVSHAVGISLR